MKKIVVILLCLLCALCTSASPMRMGTTTSYGYRSGTYTSAPVARMTSTSSMMRSTVNRTSMASPYQVRVIQTYASNITGGVTSSTTYSHIGSRRKLGTPTLGEDGMDPPIDPTGNCKCEWVWDDEKQAWVCIHCGSVMTDEQYYDGHFHDGQCPCPLPLDWTAILFLLTLACAYVTYKETKKSRA